MRAVPAPGREAAHTRPAAGVWTSPCVENRDFIREDRHWERCWVTIPSFNSHYPEIAEATDLGATLRSNMRESLPLENWGGHHSKLCYELPASSSAPQQLWGSLSLRGPDGGTGVPDVSPGGHFLHLTDGPVLKACGNRRRFIEAGSAAVSAGNGGSPP